jgi:hypothetical protein
MIKKLILNIAFLSFIIFVTEASYAQEDVSNSNNNYDCEEKYQEIVGHLKIQPQCFVDDDCKYFNYGYPFQPAVCRKAIISTSEKDKNILNLAKIEHFRQNCVYNDAVESEKYKELQSEIFNPEERCNLSRVFCLKGYCRRKNYSGFYLNYGEGIRERSPISFTEDDIVKE